MTMKMQTTVIGCENQIYPEVWGADGLFYFSVLLTSLETLF